MNCPGVSLDERLTFFVHSVFLRYTSKSFDTSIRVESLSAFSAISFIPIAFDPGGPHFRASATTLYP
jgi:hypothetical protein